VSARDEWLARQLLPPERGVTIADVIRRAGWMHTAGGTGPYLSLRARIPKLPRRAVDIAACKTFDVIEVPAVRDSTMLVPREDVAIALAAGRRSFDDRLKKLKVTRKDLDPLVKRIAKILDGGAVRSVDALRRELPAKYIRNVGYTSTLPLALRLLQCEGTVMRLPEELQLDGKTHFYRAWPSDVEIGAEPDDLDRALFERFAPWASPTTVDEFATWAGITKTAAKKVVTPRPAMRGEGGRRPGEGLFLLPFRDNYFALHRGLSNYTSANVTLLDFSNKPAPIAKLESLHHNAIVKDGELIGIWEYDRSEERIVHRTFSRADVKAAVAETERFIRDELGDHKFYALDHTGGRAGRLQFAQAN
jgi:hypothetical protein